MLRKLFWLILLLFTFWLVACEQDDVSTPTATTAAPTTSSVPADTPTGPTPELITAPTTTNTGVFISELLPGVPGGNNTEFIELYNASKQAVDLNGYTLWYLLGEGQEPTLVYEWTERADTPGHGHLLLVRSGQDFDVIPDGWYDVSLFERKGGLLLRDAEGNEVDALGWGDAPAGYVAGDAAAPPDNGASLERLPGGEAGNGQNSGRNADDFTFNPTPTPQNSGMAPTPALASDIALSLVVPDAAAPGSTFDLTLQVSNNGTETATDLLVSWAIPAGYTLAAAPEAATAMDDLLTWPITSLGAGEMVAGNITLQAPYTYDTTILRGYYVESGNGLRQYGPLQPLVVAGGAVPIAVARTLIGQTVAIEGVATMYTGGFFAGSTGTKFYLEDETGGIQVYVPEGMGVVNVDVGDQVRVTGYIELFRDSLEIIPHNVPGDVEVLAEGGSAPEPAIITAQTNEEDPAVLGRLNQIEGTILSIEEFSFSYELDLQDDQGYITTVYVEKDAGITAEPLDIGRRYRVTGISELASGQHQLKPRYQSDIAEIFPPVLLAEISAANNVQAGAGLTYTLTAINHTPDTLINVQIVAFPPPQDAALGEIFGGGAAADDTITWLIPELPGNGAAAVVSYTVQVNAAATDPILAPSIQITADNYEEIASTSPFLTFLGPSIPVWAIQGSGDKSPYGRSDATTEGIVTAVFPELDGFWLQGTPDGNEATSDGVFVFVDDFNLTVNVGDQVQVTGRVRELSGQTALDPEKATDIVILANTQPLPDPVSYDPPLDPAEALLYSESHEGMRVTLSGEAVVVAPTTQYGEYALVSQQHGVTTVERLDEVGYLIFVDDGSSIVHDDSSTLSYIVQQGDVVTSLTGVLAFTFGQYKIQPEVAPEVMTLTLEMPTVAAALPNQLSVATFNVENLFDLVDPHPSSPPRPTLDGYHTKLNKIAASIVAMGAPTIIGLQEVENMDVLEDLVAEAALAGYSYAPYLIEGNDSRGIDVAFLVRSDLATVEAVQAYDAPSELFARPPLVITTTVHLASGDIQVIAINNHFLALSAGEEATEPTRNAQAAWNAELAAQFQTNFPDAYVLVMGDLNSFYGTLPLETLGSELTHVYDLIGGSLPYTYIFEGRTQTLDHILMSENLVDHLMVVTVPHLNTPYPIAAPDDASPRHTSDHDPVVVIFTFE